MKWFLFMFLFNPEVDPVKFELPYNSEKQCIYWEELITEANKKAGYWETYSFGCHKIGIESDSEYEYLPNQ